jgi:hypothetical protein
VACRYGGATGSDCNFSDTGKTLGHFASTYGSAGAGLELAGGLGAATSRYFVVGVQLAADANNSFQGRQASMDLSWYIE